MPSKRPNILFILTDQQRADTIAALGNPIIRTPALDRLAREGTAFTSAYCASPVCVSSRASLYHGQYPARSGCYDNNFNMPGDGRPTFMGSLTAAGYRTHAIGKLHFTPDRDGLHGLQSRESQEELLPSPDGDDYLRFLRTNGGEHITDPHGVRGEMYYVPQPAQMPARLHPTQWIGDRATAFLRDPARRGSPWMLVASFIHPHPPFAPPAPWHKLYRTPDMPLPFIPDGSADLLTHHNRVQNRYKYRDRGLDLQLIRTMRAYYYACISFIDMQVAAMLRALEDSGELDNTLILFSSDHGELLGDYGSFGKRSILDAAARVPLLARWPERFAAGVRNDAPASLVDIMPTMHAAADVPRPANLDGIDLADLSPRSRPGVTIHFQHAGLALYGFVTPRVKYGYSAPDHREYVVDRGADRAESRNLADVAPRSAFADSARDALWDHLRANRHDAAFDDAGKAWRRYPTLSVPADPNKGLIFQDHAWADQRIPGYSKT